MKIDILTLFPDMFGGVLNESIIGRAQESGLVEIAVHDIRKYSANKHRRADDTPFGGGAGMVMMAQPVFDAIRGIDADRRDAGDEGGCRMLYMSPRGRVLDEGLITELGDEERIVILCGHYEGMDQRVLDYFDFEEVSVGDYILTGGELAAMIVTDAVTRLIPGVLGSCESHSEESIYSGLLEYPQYTRPADFEGIPVPDVLVSGHHRLIHLFNFRKSLELTQARRPDLFAAFALAHEEGASLDKEERAILSEVLAVHRADIANGNSGGII
jgi:tRNA (guanine37-N1)-methyltransferase